MRSPAADLLATGHEMKIRWRLKSAPPAINVTN